MEFYFSFGLIALTLCTGIIYGLDRFIFSKRRKASYPQPWLASFSYSMFPVFFIVVIIRFFLIEPYRIPSPSMVPTLQIGDFIMINKFAYGLKLPLWDFKIVSVSEPKRGDIVVLHYPVDPDRYFIKRVIGLPGDSLTYENKTLTINGKVMEQKLLRRVLQNVEENNEPALEYEENLGEVKHSILRMSSRPAVNFYNLQVPQGSYFVMGDNRDDSADSRYWGFVPEDFIVGHAAMIFFSIDWNAKDIRWSRLGQWVF